MHDLKMTDHLARRENARHEMKARTLYLFYLFIITPDGSQTYTKQQ